MKITPQQSGSVIGRDAAIASLHTLLDSNRQVTIIGPPGVGKTHLVEHLARQAGATLLGYASLLDADDEGRLIEVLAHAMGIAAQAAGRGASKDHVLRCLERMQSGLLVIDHAERVKAPLCELIQAVSGRAPDITWLVASQTRMELPYEHVFELPPLTLPTGDTLAEIQASDAVRLLVDKATATRAFEVPIAADTWRVFAQIANQLDGLPLALDLAAQRMRVLSPFEVLEHLSSRFDLLKRQAADGHLSRHQTLETALAWAWEQLPDWAQAALGQCCVFKGGFEYAAAAAVLDLSEFESAPDTLDVLETLLDHSLIRRFEQDHRSRFTLLNSISAFAAKRRPPSIALLRRHAHYYGDRGQGAAESTWRRASKERQWLLRNRENLEAVVDEQASHKAYAHSLSAVYALDEILYGTPLSQHLSRIERTLMAVKSEKPTSLSLKIGLYRGRCLRFLGRHQDSLAVLGVARRAYARSRRDRDLGHRRFGAHHARARRV